MATTSQAAPPQTPTPSADTTGLDPKQLAVASLSAVIGGVIGAAFGGSVVMTFVGMAVAPWITAFVEHPGPHRRRRVALVALLAFLVFGARKAAASERTSTTGASANRAGRVREAVQLGHVALNAAIAVVIAVLAITLGEIVAGQAIAGDRDTTIFGGASTRPDGPSLDVPDKILAKTLDSDGRRVTYPVTAADARGNPLTPACAPVSGSIFELGVTRVTCSVTDAAGRRSEGGFDVSVSRGQPAEGADTTRPTLDVPASFTRQTASADGRTVTYLAAAGDDIDGPLTANCKPASGALFALGETPVRCSATDAAGNRTRKVFTITVERSGGGGAAQDTSRPTIGALDDITRPASSAEGRTVRYSASATDDRDGVVEAICGPPSGSVFAIGPTKVRCTATDTAGNSTPGSFTVDIVDGPPVLQLPANITREADSDKGVDVTFVAEATDAVDGMPTPACTPESGSFFRIGERTVMCEVTDSAGATVTGTFTVTVSRAADTTAPTIRTKNTTVTADSADGEPVPVRFTVTATDARDGDVPVQCDPSSGSLFNVGPTPVTCRARDAAGNSADPLQLTVQVRDTRPR